MCQGLKRIEVHVTVAMNLYYGINSGCNIWRTVASTVPPPQLLGQRDNSCLSVHDTIKGHHQEPPLIDQLLELMQLKNKGSLTEEEYVRIKQVLMKAHQGEYL